MKYIVNEVIANDIQTVVPIEHDNPIFIPNPSHGYDVIQDGTLGQCFIQNSKYELVPENINKSNIYKMKCIGADIVPVVDRLSVVYKKHLVLFSKEYGDIHYELSMNDIFFPTQIGHKLMVKGPNEINLDKPNKGFEILKNITMDKMRTNFITKQI